MAELLRTHLLGERAAGVRADRSLGLRANRDPELDEVVHPGEQSAICRDSEGSPFGLAVS